MGTKRNLAAAVAEQVAKCRRGPLLDAFAGMCAVGKSVANERQVWTNDLQLFASRVGHAFFCASELPPRSFDAADLLFPLFQRQRSHLQASLAELYEQEAQALATGSLSDLAVVQEKLELFALHANEADQPAICGRYDLFTSTFAGSYLGLSQCIEVDSIRFALDVALESKRLSSQAHEWLCLSLGKAIGRSSTSTGHFAQPLGLKATNLRRFRRQRTRSIWQEWMSATHGLSPVGSQRWRLKNKNYHFEAVELLDSLKRGSDVPAVVYADPPYTTDQYSRYYHLYETLLLYDYPVSKGRGRYRVDRASSTFSLKSGVNDAVRELLESVAALGADIVLSYPTNGLLAQSREKIPDMLQQHFKRVHSPVEIEHTHSAMGGSKGAAAYSVTEVIYRASA